MATKSLSDLLDDIRDDIDTELGATPSIVKKTPESFDVEKLPLGTREWHQLNDLVAVVVDLKGSTKLSTGKHASSTASIFEASTDNAVLVLHNFEADFIQIQGDGAFGLFWGEGRYERALCAGITIKTFSVYLSDVIAEKWPDAPGTGYKVGIASGRVLAKRVGTPRNPAEQEPIWSGKPVNYAAKSAQTADADELIITGDVWANIEANDYLTSSCAHRNGDNPAPLWENVTIENLPETDDARFGRLLKSTWCSECGDAFCDAILAGQTVRPEAEEARSESMRSARSTALLNVIEKQRQLHLQRIRGLARR